MTLAPLAGPRLPPLRGEAAQLVVLLHGYGADGEDLIGLAPMLRKALPGAAFAAPNAPQRCAGAPMGRQWFAISRLDAEEARRGVENASSALENFLDSELSRLGLPADRLALVGFSQGAMMALHAGLRRSAKPAAVVGFSGMLAGQPPALGADAPPILLIHGAADPMIPVQALFDAAGRLGAAGAAVQWRVSPGLGHSIDETGVTLAAMHLSMAFRGLLRRRQPEICCALG